MVLGFRFWVLSYPFEKETFSKGLFNFKEWFNKPLNPLNP